MMIFGKCESKKPEKSKRTSLVTAEQQAAHEQKTLASRPHHQFVYQVSKEREWLEDEMHGGVVDFDCEAYKNVKNSWIRQKIWNPRWDDIPGQTWMHEEPDEEDSGTLSGFVGVLEDLIPSKNLILCAHSMSAKATCELLASLLLPTSSPSIAITAILLMAPAPPTPLILPAKIREQQLIAYESLESAKWTMQNVLTAGKLSEEMIDSLAKDAVGMSKGAKGGWIELGMAHDCSASLKRLSEAGKRVPVKVLVGREDKIETVDRVSKETVEVCAASGWDISMRVIEGVGHLLPVEAVDDVVNAVMGLLEDVG